MFIRIYVIVFCLWTQLDNFVFSQCCSSGSPLGISSTGASIDRGLLRTSSFIRYNKSEGYMEGTKHLDNTGLLTHSNFVFHGLILNYGISHRLSSELELGYYYAKTQYFRLLPDQKLQARGLSNGTIIFRYALLNPVKYGYNLSFGAGLKFPFTVQPKYYNHVRLPEDIQPSTQAFGSIFNLSLYKDFSKWKFSVSNHNRFEYNFANISDYRYGNKLSSSLFLIKRLHPDLAVILASRFDFITQDIAGGKPMVNTGASMLSLSPQLRYIVNKKWYLTGIFEMPIYRDMNGRQIAYNYSASLALMREFNLGNKSDKTPSPFLYQRDTL